MGSTGELNDNGNRDRKTLLPLAGPRQAQEQEWGLNGPGISLAWSGLSPCEVPTFEAGGVGVPILTPFFVGWMKRSLLLESTKAKYPGRF